jgi:hypothetical protein
VGGSVGLDVCPEIAQPPEISGATDNFYNCVTVDLAFLPTEFPIDLTVRSRISNKSMELNRLCSRFKPFILIQ